MVLERSPINLLCRCNPRNFSRLSRRLWPTWRSAGIWGEKTVAHHFDRLALHILPRLYDHSVRAGYRLNLNLLKAVQPAREGEVR
jgi:hypothetical protein